MSTTAHKQTIVLVHGAYADSSSSVPSGQPLALRRDQYLECAWSAHVLPLF